jgi:hypothetical protein
MEQDKGKNIFFEVKDSLVDTIIRLTTISLG